MRKKKISVMDNYRNIIEMENNNKKIQNLIKMTLFDSLFYCSQQQCRKYAAINHSWLWVDLILIIFVQSNSPARDRVYCPKTYDHNNIHMPFPLPPIVS